MERRAVGRADVRHAEIVGELPPPVRHGGLGTAVAGDPVNRRQPVGGGKVGPRVVRGSPAQLGVHDVSPGLPAGLQVPAAFLDVREHVFALPEGADQAAELAGLRGDILEGGDVLVYPQVADACLPELPAPVPSVPRPVVVTRAVSGADDRSLAELHVGGIVDVRLELAVVACQDHAGDDDPGTLSGHDVRGFLAGQPPGPERGDAG